MDNKPKQNNEDVERADVEVSSPWFKMKLEDIDWKTVVVVAMILLTIVYLVKG
jgi:hypothetical protein